MSCQFASKIDEVYHQIGEHAHLVLATSRNQHVSARTMSFIIIDNNFYFQTDNTFRKYQDVKQNHYVAICIDNIQIEGICEEYGQPLENKQFMAKFQKYFPSSYQAYSSLSSERLFVVKPIFIQRWTYVNEKPLVEQFYCEEHQYVEK